MLPIVEEARWAPGTVWTGAENLDPNGIRSPGIISYNISIFVFLET